VLAEAWAMSWDTDTRPPNTKDVDVPVKLGPVGGHLVAETVAALLVSDSESSINQQNFTPIPQWWRNGRFGLAEMINAALGR
jgi:hypothetical protein